MPAVPQRHRAVLRPAILDHRAAVARHRHRPVVSPRPASPERATHATDAFSYVIVPFDNGPAAGGPPLGRRDGALVATVRSERRSRGL